MCNGFSINVPTGIITAPRRFCPHCDVYVDDPHNCREYLVEQIKHLTGQIRRIAERIRSLET